MKRGFIFLGITTFLLFSCSKDEPVSAPEQQPQSLKGVFTDSNVEGLRYETETKSGFTDENGNYDYVDGETVTFFVGDIELGSAIASEEMTPISIASTPGADITTPEVQNIAAFLQSLDIDGDPSNGIKITSEVTNAISTSQIDFTKPIIQVLGEISLEVFQSTEIDLKVIYPEMAAVHLAQNLGLEYQPEPSFSLNFLPTFTHFYGRNALWVHEFDEQGKLLRSTMYEKYPFRIKQEFDFNEYDDENFTVNFVMKTYEYKHGDDTNNRSYELIYDPEFSIHKISTSNDSGPITTSSTYEFKELNDKGWVTSAFNTYETDDGTNYNVYEYNSTYEYNEEGLIIQMKDFNISGDLTSTVDYTYTDFGDIKIRTSTTSTGTSTIEYFYRSDHTLEKEEWTAKSLHVVTEYDENEALLKDTVQYGENLRDTTIDYYDAGVHTRFEWYINDVINQISYYQPDGNGDSYLSKIETYGKDGLLDFTTYYDEEGNEIETVYA